MNATDRKVIRLAADIILDFARSHKECCTLRGKWPQTKDAESDRKWHSHLTWNAAQLRMIARRRK